MNKKQFQKIVNDIKKLILRDAKKNDWLWFYNLHQKEVIRSAEELLKIYSKADKQIVMIACWLHDISKFWAKKGKSFNKAHADHHVDSANFAGDFLKKYNLDQEMIEKITQCVLRHRNTAPYQVRTLEEKIVAVADTLSHFTGIFYFSYFKFHPESSIDLMVKTNLEKINRDWSDLGLLPKSRKIVERELAAIKKLHENFLKK